MRAGTTPACRWRRRPPTATSANAPAGGSWRWPKPTPARAAKPRASPTCRRGPASPRRPTPRWPAPARPTPPARLTQQRAQCALLQQGAGGAHRRSTPRRSKRKLAAAPVDAAACPRCMPIASVPAEVLAQRPDVYAAELNVAAASADVGRGRAPSAFRACRCRARSRGCSCARRRQHRRSTPGPSARWR